ncbi:hypothetical protein PoB_006158500 [Plakobranchus ocellatus]|uniref:Uncharacterized protein n=1 Tax=Plakobranchus ocellatus TaxID=259542 RepID=A0AAV4CTA2_9GAST|nr:hypothetical protein PoB_006158500 [Plakobranchus ocellatus]
MADEVPLPMTAQPGEVQSHHCEDFPWLSKLELKDSFYHALKSHFFMMGKGRRPKLPDANLTNRFLLQLFSLKEEKGASWAEMTDWYLRLIPSQPVSTGRLEYRVQKIMKLVHHLIHEGRESELPHFLSTSVDFDELSQSLSCIGLTRAVLLGNPSTFEAPTDLIITYGLVSELETFRSRERLPNTFLPMWIKQLSHATLTAAQMRHKLTVVVKKIKEMKLKKTKTDVEELFRQSIFDTNIDSQLTDTKNKDTEYDSCRLCKSEMKVIKEELKKSKENEQKLQDIIKNQSIKLHVLEEEQMKLNTFKDISNIEKDMDKKVKELKKANDQLRSELSNVKTSTLYKKNFHLKKQNKTLHEKYCELQEVNSNLLEEIKNLNKEINVLKAKVKVERTTKLRLQKRLQNEKSTTAALCEVIKDDDDDKEIKLKEERFNQFSDNVRLTYMTLQGEANVAASNCTKVVQIVAKNMFNTNLTYSELPSCSAALNFADEAHHLAKYQVVESVRKCNHFTLATDGTSRQKKHFIERHILLDDGTPMSVGFTEIASDDAQTLLEKTIDMFHDLCEVYNSSEVVDKEKLFKEIVGKMKCLMSDRASVMKLFDKKVAEFKNNLLGDDASTHFLFCNAHFLLGLSKATEDAIKEIEIAAVSESDTSLGRDASIVFSNFSNSSESAVCRLVRLTAEVLGPRGDEKSGCREEWLAYCSSLGKKSTFTSFRSNRFNNLFENASAVVFHHKDVFSFLLDHCSHSNLKLKSIIADLQDSRILNIVAAMSLFHALFSAPYWSLMNSSESYGQFPQYVSKMKTSLEIWCEPLFELTAAKSVFENFLSDSTFILDFINSLPGAAKDSVLSSFKLISQHCYTVLKRQLCDFLDGGPFAGVLNDEVQSVLNTCPLTNLIGERMFGDLDFDMSKRRHASTHLRTTINMWKHNKTSKWIAKQNWTKARKLLSSARKHRADWKNKSKLSEQTVKNIIKDRIIENNRKKKEKETQNAEKKVELFNTILSHGGVCTTKSDVDKLYRGPNASENLKAQLRYRKCILNEKDVKISGGKKQLYSRLLKQLGLRHSP